jgi:hypothetical protein
VSYDMVESDMYFHGGRYIEVGRYKWLSVETFWTKL